MKYDIRVKISLLYFCHYHTLNGQLKSLCKIWHHQDISVFLSSSHSYGLLCTFDGFGLLTCKYKYQNCISLKLLNFELPYCLIQIILMNLLARQIPATWRYPSQIYSLEWNWATDHKIVLTYAQQCHVNQQFFLQEKYRILLWKSTFWSHIDFWWTANFVGNTPVTHSLVQIQFVQFFLKNT